MNTVGLIMCGNQDTYLSISCKSIQWYFSVLYLKPDWSCTYTQGLLLFFLSTQIIEHLKDFPFFFSLSIESQNLSQQSTWASSSFWWNSSSKCKQINKSFLSSWQSHNWFLWSPHYSCSGALGFFFLIQITPKARKESVKTEGTSSTSLYLGLLKHKTYGPTYDDIW